MDFHGWGPNCWRNWFWWIVQTSMISWYHPAGRFPGDGPSAEIPLGGCSVLLETNLQLITVWRGFNEIKSEILLDITQSSFKLGSNSIQRPQPPSPFTEVKMSRSVFVSISDGEVHMSDMSDGCQWLMVKRGFFMRFMKLCGPPIPSFSPLCVKRFRNSNCYCLVSGPWTSIFAECAHLGNRIEKTTSSQVTPKQRWKKHGEQCQSSFKVLKHPNDKSDYFTSATVPMRSELHGFVCWGTPISISMVWWRRLDVPMGIVTGWKAPWQIHVSKLTDQSPNLLISSWLLSGSRCWIRFTFSCARETCPMLRPHSYGVISPINTEYPVYRKSTSPATIYHLPSQYVPLFTIKSSSSIPKKTHTHTRTQKKSCSFTKIYPNFTPNISPKNILDVSMFNDYKTPIFPLVWLVSPYYYISFINHFQQNSVPPLLSTINHY